jgi:hypothetical protein
MRIKYTKIQNTFPQMWGENVGKCEAQKGSNTPKQIFTN